MCREASSEWSFPESEADQSEISRSRDPLETAWTDGIEIVGIVIIEHLRPIDVQFPMGILIFSRVSGCNPCKCRTKSVKTSFCS